MTEKPRRIVAPVLENRLETVSRRHGLTMLWKEILTLASLAVLGLFLLMGMDGWVQPGRIERGVLLGGVLAVLAFQAVRYFLRSGRLRPTRDDHARHLAGCLEDCDELLRSASDFLHRTTQGESEDLRQAVVRQAESLAHRDRETDLPSPGRLTRTKILLVASLLPLTIIACLDPDRAVIGMQRTVLLRPLSYPTRTRMVLLDPDPSKPMRGIQGRDLRITAMAEGFPVDTAVLHRITASGRIRQTMIRGRAGKFVGVIHGLAAPERFFLTAGDDRDERPLYPVQVVVPPRIIRVETTEVFPPYTGREPLTHHDPALSLLRGSRITLSVVASKPLRQARIQLDHEEPVAMQSIDPTRFQAVFDPAGHFEYAIHLLDTEGLENLPAPIHPIRFYPDRPPRVRLQAPVVTGPVTARARLDIRALLEDDHGTVAASCHLHPEGRPDQGHRAPLQLKDQTLALGELALDTCRVLSAHGPRPPEPGDRLILRVAASDGCDQTGRSRAVSLIVATIQEVESHLLNRVLEVKHGLETRADMLDRTRRRLEAFLPRLPDPTRVAENTRTTVHQVNVAARDGRIALATALDRLSGIRGQYARNRILSEPRAHRLEEAANQLREAHTLLEMDLTRGILAARTILEENAGNGPKALRNLGVEIARTSERIRGAVRILSVFVNFREVVRHARCALDAQEDVHTTLLRILEEAALSRSVGRLLDAGVAGILVSSREIDLVRLGLDTLVKDPIQRGGPARTSLEKWRDRMDEAGFLTLAGQVHLSLVHRRPGDGLGPSRLLRAHLRALVADLARLSSPPREARAGIPAATEGSLDRKRLDELLKQAGTLLEDMKKATRDLDPSALTEAIKKLLKKTKDLGKDLGRMMPPPENEGKEEEKARTESLRRMLGRVRQKLEKGDTRGAVVITEALLNQLRTSRLRKAAERPEVNLDPLKRPGTPDRKGQNLSGEYRPGAGTAPDLVLPESPGKKGAPLRWGELPPVRGGGSFLDVPRGLPGRYRKALEAYYRRLGEAR